MEGEGLLDELAPPDLRAWAARSSATTRRRSQLFGIDGVAHRRRASRWPSSAWSPPGGCSAVEIGPLRGDREAARARRALRRIPFLYRASLNKWWFDELNHLLFVVIGGRVADALWWFDRNVIDGIVNGIGALTRGRRRRASPRPDRAASRTTRWASPSG